MRWLMRYTQVRTTEVEHGNLGSGRLLEQPREVPRPAAYLHNVRELSFDILEVSIRIVLGCRQDGQTTIIRSNMLLATSFLT
jgi:hypothetical protein